MANKTTKATKAPRTRYIISGYHQFSDGIEIVEIPVVFNSIKAAAKDVCSTVNETILSCDSGQDPVTPDDCTDGYKFESDSGEVLALKIVEVKR